MPRVYVPTALRRRIVDRAQGIREYCLFPETLSSLRLVIDHVIAAKHGGLTESENLANACVFATRPKAVTSDRFTGRAASLCDCSTRVPIDGRSIFDCREAESKVYQRSES